MPIYKYRCDDCLESFELLVRSASTLKQPVCVRCGSVHVEKQVTAFAMVGGGDSRSG